MLEVTCLVLVTVCLLSFVREGQLVDREQRRRFLERWRK